MKRAKTSEEEKRKEEKKEEETSRPMGIPWAPRLSTVKAGLLAARDRRCAPTAVRAEGEGERRGAGAQGETGDNRAGIRRLRKWKLKCGVSLVSLRAWISVLLCLDHPS